MSRSPSQSSSSTDALYQVRRIRWSPRIASLLAAGHEDCSITIYRTVTDKSQKFKCKDKDLGAHTGVRSHLAHTFSQIRTNYGQFHGKAHLEFAMHRIWETVPFRL